ncbi:MAG: type II secretion system minor pseudopilin GspK, partial [Nitrospirota bacterium]|nr:type II secretion system minor pseudopilin GspK [Nitrospirota bacterium]
MKDRSSINSNPSHLKNQKGSALIITLLLITILVGLVVDFVYEVYIDSSSLSNWSNAQKASLVAKSGQTLSTHYLTKVNNYTYTYTKELVLPVLIDLGPDTSLYIKVEDENSKFNINSIINDRGSTNEDALASLKKLLEYLNINPDLSLAIADWIDPDSEPRLSDSENVAKNTYFWSVDELKSVNGMTADIFNKLSPYVTVYGDGRINVNTAELPVLVSLSGDMTETFANNIIESRKNKPFENANEIVRVSGLKAIGIRILGKISVKGSSFRVTATARVNEISRV